MKKKAAAAGAGIDPDKFPEQTGLGSDAVSGVDGVPIEGFRYDPASLDGDDKYAIPGSPGLYTRLTVTLLDGPLPANWTLRLQNQDGKYAEVQVAMDSPPPVAPNAELAMPAPQPTAGANPGTNTPAAGTAAADPPTDV